MKTEIITLIVNALVAAVSGPLGAWLNSKMLRAKYRTEVDKLRAELAQLRTDTRGHELENVRKATEILMEGVVTPLKSEIKQLRYELNRMRRAIEKIPSCPHADTCPVSHELLEEDTDDGDKKSARRQSAQRTPGRQSGTASNGGTPGEPD